MRSFEGFRFKLCLFTLVLLSLASLVACGPKTPEPPPPLTVEMLMNAEYHSEWPAEGVAKLTDGEYQEEIVPGAASKLIIAVYPDMYAFGDLNGDGVDDAAVVLATSAGGSGTFISLEAVINDQGTPKHVASAELGDRAKIESVMIESGEITVDMLTHGPEDPMCCPTVEATQRYKLQGDTLVQISGGD
jgi:predicted small lipoprotein YifL